MRLSDFDYQLPEELIAQQPLPERGASRLLCLEGVSGKYFRPDGESTSSKQSYDTEVARRLWEVSEQLTGLAP